MNTSFEMTHITNQRRADTIREAEQRRTQTMLVVPTRRPALARLGKLLSQAGDSLQQRYGEEANNLA